MEVKGSLYMEAFIRHSTGYNKAGRRLLAAVSS